MCPHVHTQLLGQSDMALVTKSDLTGAAAQLGSVTAVATAGITAAASMDPTDPADWPNTAAVLKNIRGEWRGTATWARATATARARPWLSGQRIIIGHFTRRPSATFYPTSN